MAVIGIMVLFGSAYPAGKLGINHFPPFLFSTLRSTLLAIILLPFWKLRLPPRDLALPLAGFCGCMGVGVYATMYAALGMSTSVSPIIIGSQLSIPFAVLLGWLMLKEQVPIAIWMAILLGFAGIVVIAYEPRLLADLPALGWVVVSALFYALATILARQLREMSPYMLNGWMALTAVLPLFGLSLFFESDQMVAISSTSLPHWLTLIHSAVAVSFIAHVGMFSLYRHYEVAQIFPFYALTPVFGILLTIIAFPEIPSAQTLFGGAMVIAASYSIGRRKSA
ncbi:MAG: DMT family transporter [Rhodospirillales bacterium]|nr:DMT family transporter [Rhodospirillales bacterium]